MTVPTEAYGGLGALFADNGYAFIEPPIIHDASVFVDLAGEDLRRRMYLTADSEGREQALRPDYTIPVCLAHLNGASPARRADYAYLGPVFRQRGDAPGEFLQAGVESFGRAGRTAADADTLQLAAAAARELGLKKPAIRLGDPTLFSALIAGLDIAPPWRRRLARTFGDAPRLSALVAEARSPSRSRRHELHGASPAKVRSAISDKLRESGLETLGGRQVDEIARRFIDKESLRQGIGKRTADTLEQFLAIHADPAAAIRDIRRLSKRRRIDLGPALDRLEKRLAAFDKRGLAVGDMVFATDFGRRLDYYTGFVFELLKSPNADEPVIGGGRYDKLMSMLGAPKAVPAVGFAIWLERAGAAS